MPPISTERSQGQQPPFDGFDEDGEEQHLSGRPQLAARPTLVGRVRDWLMMQRVLGRGERAVETDDSVQIVSGRGAPRRPARGGTMYSHPSNVYPASAGFDPPFASTPDPDAASVHTGHVEMQSVPVEEELDFELPGGGGIGTSAEFMGGAAEAQSAGGDGAIGFEPAPFNAFSGQLGPLVQPPAETVPGEDQAAGAPRRERAGRRGYGRAEAHPAGHVISEFDDEDLDWEAAGGRSGRVPRREAGRRSPWRPPLASHLAQIRKGAGREHLPLAVFVGAVLVLMIIGLATGRSTSGQGIATAPSAAISRPRVAAPQVPAVPPPAAVAPLAGEKDLGSGGAGYQVKDLRYGVHPGDFRIVLDLSDAGGATGVPKVVIGWTGASTFEVRLSGVVAAGSTGQLPNADPVKSVLLVQPSPVPGATVYQFTVAHPVTFTSAYAQSPLRLVIDLH